jgi:hypothetical protein
LNRKGTKHAKVFSFSWPKRPDQEKNHALQAKYILMRKKVLLPKDVSFDFQGGLAENQKAFLSVLGVLSEAGGECSYVFSDTLP